MRKGFLVTGGASFIGSHLTARLLAEGGGVRVLDNFSTGSLANLPAAGAESAKLEIIRGDIRDLGAVERAAAGTTAIFHQAAMRSVPRSVADPLGANEHNVTGTLHVFEAARRAGVRRVVYASSSSVYGDRPELPKQEDQAPAPIYGGGGGRTSLLEIIARLETILGRAIERRHTPSRAGDVPHTLADVSKAKRLLGYTPLVGFDEGLARTVDYFRSIHED